MDLSRAEVLKSEMRRSVVSKLQFGSKHDAARFAAEQRWKGHVSLKAERKQIAAMVNGQKEAVSFLAEKKPFSEVKMGDIVLNTKGQPAWVIRKGLVPRGLGMTEHTMTLAQAEFKRTRKGFVARMGHEFYQRPHGALEVLNDKTVAEVTVLTPTEPLAKEFMLRKALYGGAF